MDLSYSMNDDLKKVKDLGTDILKALKQITPYARIGFGSFVDKTVLPYTNTHPDKLKKPCPDAEQRCQAAFGYQHVLSLTDDGSRFQQEVSNQFISGNLDSPEGGLDAMMQAAVCGDKIGWGNNTRLLVYTSDDGFHFAGDGKLGSILTPNDGKCHLEGNRYTKSNELDYPSVGQLAQKLDENNIQPIFAVTTNMQSVYKELSDMIPKSAVGELSTDSSNVVTLIKDAYSNLSSTVIIEHNRLPDGVSILYKSNCADETRKNEPRGSCSNVKINNEISFDVTVTAERCMKPQSFEIRPLGFTEKLTVKITTPCQCECDDQRDAADCTSKGHIECGICSCDSGHVGQNCECRVGDKTEKELNQGCRRDNGTSICSNLGDCVCGVCQCHASETPGKQIYGTFCECDNMNCELNNGKLCGAGGATVSATCASASLAISRLSVESAQPARHLVQNMRKLILTESNGIPVISGACIECLGFQRGPYSKNCSKACSHITHTNEDKVVNRKVCKEKDSENCWMIFIMEELDGVNQYKAIISKERECPEPPNIAAIVAGTVAGVALIGLVLLLIWKIIAFLHDRQEYRKFEKDKANAKWNKTHKTGNNFTYDIHYWLGKVSSQDEQGAAAIYTTQIDDHLGGVAVQHREEQGSESETFRGYFKQGIIYKQGGVASGMKHVETNVYNIKRLLHVKGKKHVVAGEVEMSWNSFNKGDVFLLDLGKGIIQWNGPESNRMERIKGMNLAKDIRDRERGGRAKVAVVDGENERDSPQLMKLLNEVLGVRNDIKAAIPDEVVDHKLKTAVKLFHVSDTDGNLVVKEVAVSPLTQDLLDHDDCYLLDQGGIKIFVWKGKNASKKERSESLNRAEGYKKAKGYPSSTNVEIVNDGSESAVFKQLFKKWTVKGLTVGTGSTHSVGKIAKVEQVKFDATSMHAKPEVAAQQRMVDDGTGEVEVWRIENLEPIPVEKKWLGHFYGGDCYLILYKYLVNNKEHYIIYVWQGRNASQDEIAASAFQAVILDQKYNGQPVQVRVPMGKEPPHLMAVFRGKMVVYEGGTSRSGATEPEPAERLFHVHGTNEHNTRSIEVPARASSLNSNDVFVLKSDSCCYLWYGKVSNRSTHQQSTLNDESAVGYSHPILPAMQ
ncbi:UNVERIFIED_CONTAM: hypothetical protein FKN15_031646 [Acipenser sinensis]